MHPACRRGLFGFALQVFERNELGGEQQLTGLPADASAALLATSGSAAGEGGIGEQAFDKAVSWFRTP